MLFFFQVAVGDASNGYLNVYDEDTLDLITTFRAHSGPIYRLKQITYNDYLAKSSGDGSVKIWNPFNNWQLIDHGSNWVYALEYLKSDSMVSGSVDRTIKIWYIITGQTSRTISTGWEVFSLKLLSNGFYLAAGLGDSKIHIFSVNTGSLITTLNGHTGRVRDLVLIGNLLANSSEDTTISYIHHQVQFKWT